MKDSFSTVRTLDLGGESAQIAHLPSLEKQGFNLSRLPYSLRILLENLLRREDGEVVPAVYEYRVQRVNGELRTVQASSVATTFDGRPATLAILRDMTVALREKEIREGLQVRLGELVEHGEENFAELVRALAREHQRLFGAEAAASR